MAVDGDSPERVDGPMKKLLNFTCFQIGWFACAVGATGGRPLLGPLVVGVLLTLQFTQVPSPGRQCRFVLTATLLGWLVDSGLATAGVFSLLVSGWFQDREGQVERSYDPIR